MVNRKYYEMKVINIKTSFRISIPTTCFRKFYVRRSMYEEQFDDTEGVIRIRKQKKNREHNGQKKKEKQRSTIKDRVTRTPLKPVVNSDAPEVVPVPLVALVVLFQLSTE